MVVPPLKVEHLKKIWMSQDYHETSSAKNLMVSVIRLADKGEEMWVK